MLAGIVLIAAGIGILLTAADFRSVADDIERWRVNDMRRRRVRQPLVRLASVEAKWSPGVQTWLSWAIAVAAIVGGIVLLIRG